MDFAKALLTWFDLHGRKDLPWQQHVTPYGVWISEIMLQQTQVKTVIPFYLRFMARFPGAEALASASEDEVLHYWTGLGYYARARNLHKTAKTIVKDFQGGFPQSVNELEQLPGIGTSTAGAIAAIAFNHRAPILDGNVKRVLTRCFAIAGYPGDLKVARRLWQLAEQLTPQTRVADYTQAIMDLGATVCTRSSPACDTCPLVKHCLASGAGSVDQYPGRKKTRKLPVKTVSMLVIANSQGELLLEKRPHHGIWGGLWGFPEGGLDDTDDEINGRLAQLNLAPTQLERTEQLPSFRHTFTHFHLDITPIHIQLMSAADSGGKFSIIEAEIGPGTGPETWAVEEANTRMWFHPRKGVEIGLTAPVTRLLRQLQDH